MVEPKQEALALIFASPQGATSRPRTPSSHTSYTSAGSFKKVRLAYTLSYPPHCRICLCQEPVHCTTLIPAMRAPILQERKRNFRTAKNIYAESDSHHTAYGDFCCLQGRYGYRTPLEKPTQPVLAPPTQRPAALAVAPLTLQGSAVTLVAPM